MTNWRAFLAIAGRYLRDNNQWSFGEWSNTGRDPLRRTWCSWTTFDRLQTDAGYWTGELPLESELTEEYVTDGGTWGQPFPYDALAHVIVPRQFLEEQAAPGEFFLWIHEQELEGLSQQLSAAGIAHELSRHALDIKLF